MRNPVTRQMMANHLENTKCRIKNTKYKVCIEMPNEFGCKYLSKLERGFHWNSIHPWGENWPKKRLILPLKKIKDFLLNFQIWTKTCKWESRKDPSSGRFSIATTWVSSSQDGIVLILWPSPWKIQSPEGVDAKDCPSSIADEHVQDPMVPPVART